jgi:hypothetical protein
MPINTYLIGNDGNVTNTTAGDVIKVKTFAATLTRPESDLTGFGDSGKRRRLGLLDLTGSLNGVPAIDSSATTNAASFFVSTSTAALTLTLYDVVGTTTAATNDARIAANCVFNNFAFNVDKNGDSTLTCNFSNGDGTAPVVTWLV